MSALAQLPDSNPLHSTVDLAEGERLYRRNCASCHGIDGRSGRGAVLTTNYKQHGNSDADLFRVIRHGITGTEMPPSRFRAEGIWKIILFVRKLEVDGVEPCPVTPGRSDIGAELFAEAACLHCHRVGSKGGRLGPNLSVIGATRSREHLRQAIEKPSAVISERYQTVRVITAADEQQEGILLNEDEYTLHMMSRKEQLLSFYKNDLIGIEKPVDSLMPKLAPLLNERRVNHILSYLCSLGPVSEK